MNKQTLTAAACLCAALYAQPAETSDTISLREVEVVSNRASEKTPVAFTDINRKQIEKVNTGRDVPFLLSMAPSVVFTSDAGAGVGYSSMSVRGTDATRINVTINGVPVNDAESHRVYWVNMPDLASSLRDIQIQRGAGTSTNGAGAFGASVNMLTSAPSTDPYATVSASYGSYNTHKETITAGTGLLGDHWTAEARISNIGSDGYIDRATSNLWSYLGQVAYQNGGTTLRLIAFGGKEETYMAWDYASKEEMEKYGRRYNPCGKYTDSDGKTAFYPDQKDNYIQHNAQLHFGQAIGDRWRLNAALHYTSGRGYYRQYKTDRTLSEYGLAPFFDAEGTKVKKSDLIRLKHDNNDFGGGSLAANYSYGRLDITLGAAANNYSADHFGQVEWVRNYIGALDPQQQYYDNTSNKFDFNTFARANVDIDRHFSAFADMQYRHINYRLDGSNDNYDYAADGMQDMNYRERYNFFNPKAGVSYYDGRHSRAFASWSVAHKEPTRSNFTDGDPAHKPTAERLFDYELGYTFSHRIFSVGVNLYYMDYKDQLVLTGQLSDTGNPLSVNVPHSYRTGIELQGALKPCRWFDWQLNATLSRNRIKDFTEYIYEDGWTNPISRYVGSTPIAFSPSFILNNAFNFSVAGFDASLQSHYVSKQYMTNAHCEEDVLDAYFVTDLFAGYTFRNFIGLKELRVGINVNNLFNEKYESNGYAGAGYYTDKAGEKVIYRYAGYAAQAPTNVLATITLKL
ncbi:MAG: TonB-dependent receptor [Muribaculaceae bacterium]|nr:TonB-dependent receptor [Muribaculaceae bacterium]